MARKDSKNRITTVVEDNDKKNDLGQTSNRPPSHRGGSERSKKGSKSKSGSSKSKSGSSKSKK